MPGCTIPMGGVGGGGGVGLSRRVARVGLAVGERVLSCTGEWVGLLHS